MPSGQCGQELEHGCQMVIARIYDCMCLALWAWRTMALLRYAAKFDPFLSWIAPPTLHPGAIQGKEGIKFCYLATLSWSGIPVSKEEDKWLAKCIPLPPVELEIVGGPQEEEERGLNRNCNLIWGRRGRHNTRLLILQFPLVRKTAQKLDNFPCNNYYLSVGHW